MIPESTYTVRKLFDTIRETEKGEEILTGETVRAFTPYLDVSLSPGFFRAMEIIFNDCVQLQNPSELLTFALTRLLTTVHPIKNSDTESP